MYWFPHTAPVCCWCRRPVAVEDSLGQCSLGMRWVYLDADHQPMNRLQSLSVHNTRLFRTTQRLQFDEATPDLHLIVGAGGSGKTTLVDAIRAALFGRLLDTGWHLVSRPKPDSADNCPQSGQIVMGIDADEHTYRLERSIQLVEHDESITERVGPPEWAGLDHARTPPETTMGPRRSSKAGAVLPENATGVLLNHGENVSSRDSAWASYTERLLTAVAACRPDVSDPGDLWREFMDAVDTYVDTVGPAPNYEVYTKSMPFSLRVTHLNRESPAETTLSRGRTAQLTYALRLAAGDCAGVPQVFDVPFLQFDAEARRRLAAGFCSAATSRQVIICTTPTTAQQLAEIDVPVATTYWIEQRDMSSTIDRRDLDSLD